MTRLDRLLLQVLPTMPTLLTARELAETTQLPLSLVRQALPHLITLGCLDQVDRGVYCTTGFVERLQEDLAGE